jgi:glucuronoarabinoxylan endo-1,4-beta-xylanase
MFQRYLLKFIRWLSMISSPIRLARAGQMIWAAAAALLLMDLGAQGQPSQCVVDGGTVYQRIDGFGASSAFVEGWAGVWADLFYSTNTGAGLSLLRSSMAPDGTSGETDIMQMAQARGARVWSTPWSPPAAYKDTGTVDGGAFLSVDNAAYASLLANYVLDMQTNYQVDLYALSIQNEPDYITTTYGSCNWSAQQMHDFVPYLSQALSNNGVGGTRILLAEEGLWDFSLAADALSDPATAGLVGIVAAHDYNFVVTPVATGGKPLWQTEVATWEDYDGSISNGLYWAGQIHAFMTVAQANAYNYWWLISLTTDNEGLTDVWGNPAKRLYVFGQFSRFVRPGYYRIGASNNGAALISAYQDPATGNFAIVAINTNAAGLEQAFTLTPFTAGEVTPWITSGSLSLAGQAAVPVSNGSFSYLLPAQSVVTFVGQTNLAVAITAQPQNQVVNAGANALFSIGVSGAAPLSYQWQQNGASLAGATNPACLLSNVAAGATGNQYSCVVSNVYGALRSAGATLTVTAPACAEPPPGIMAWWPGESNGLDIIGGNDGVLSNGVGFASAEVGEGFVFNGTNSYVALPLNLFPLAGSNSFSIELWFETTGGGVILAQQAGAPFGDPTDGWVPDLYVGTDGNLYVQLFWDGAYQPVTNSIPVNDGNYHHVAVTYDGINEVVYLDGATLGAKRLPNNSSTSYFNCQLGTGYTQHWPAGNGGWFTFNGVIDAPSLYSNALSAAQVQSIYNAGAVGKCRDELMPAQTTNQIAGAGSDITLGFAAAGTAPASYQWKVNGANILGATGSTLNLTNLQTSNAGLYSLTLNTPAGTECLSTILTVGTLLNVSKTGNQPVLHWNGPWTLQESGIAGGPYADVPGATSPYTNVTGAKPEGFFRLRSNSTNLITSPGFASNGFLLGASGVPGYNFCIQASSDLIHWVALQTNTPPFQFVDTKASNYPARFYRMSLIQ